MTTTKREYAESPSSRCDSLVGVQQEKCNKPVFLVDGRSITPRPMCFDCLLIDVYVLSSIVATAKMFRQDDMIAVALKSAPQVIKDFYFAVSSKLAKEQLDKSLGTVDHRVMTDPYGSYRLPFRGMENTPISHESVTVGHLVGYVWKASALMPSDLRKSEGLIMAVHAILPDKIKASTVEQLRSVHEWITDANEPGREKVLKEAHAMIVARLEELTTEDLPSPNAEAAT
jgi:hypothetical protein